MGLVCGLAMDTLIGRTLGWYGMCLFLVCFAIGMINSKLYKENPLIPVFFVFVSSLAVELMYYFINFFLKGYQDFGFVITGVILPRACTIRCLHCLYIRWCYICIKNWINTILFIHAYNEVLKYERGTAKKTEF